MIMKQQVIELDDDIEDYSDNENWINDKLKFEKNNSFNRFQGLKQQTKIINQSQKRINKPINSNINESLLDHESFRIIQDGPFSSTSYDIVETNSNTANTHKTTNTTNTTTSKTNDKTTDKIQSDKHDENKYSKFFKVGGSNHRESPQLQILQSLDKDIKWSPVVLLDEDTNHLQNPRRSISNTKQICGSDLVKSIYSHINYSKPIELPKKSHFISNSTQRKRDIECDNDLSVDFSTRHTFESTKKKSNRSTPSPNREILNNEDVTDVDEEFLLIESKSVINQRKTPLTSKSKKVHDTLQSIEDTKSAYTFSDNRNESESKGSWNCKSCTFLNPIDSTSCEVCDEVRTTIESTNSATQRFLSKTKSMLICPICTLENKAFAKNCVACFHSFIQKDDNKDNIADHSSSKKRDHRKKVIYSSDEESQGSLKDFIVNDDSEIDEESLDDSSDYVDSSPRSSKKFPDRDSNVMELDASDIDNDQDNVIEDYFDIESFATEESNYIRGLPVLDPTFPKISKHFW